MPDSEPCISGTVVLTQQLVIEELLGKDLVARVRARQSAEDRRAYDEATHISWVPVPAVERHLHACAAEAGMDTDTLHARASRLTTGRNVRTIWRVLLRFTTDQALIARTPLFYAKTFNRGSLRSAIVSPGLVEMYLSGWAQITDMQIRGLAYGTEAVLAAAGRKDPSVKGERTTDGAKYVARWKV